MAVAGIVIDRLSIEMGAEPPVSLAKCMIGQARKQMVKRVIA